MTGSAIKRLEGLGLVITREDIKRLETIYNGVVSAILVECNLTALPPEWKSIAAERCAGTFLYELWSLRSDRLGEGWFAGGISDIREGDTGVSFDTATGAAEKWLAEMMACGKQEIDRRRRVAW